MRIFYMYMVYVYVYCIYIRSIAAVGYLVVTLHGTRRLTVFMVPRCPRMSSGVHGGPPRGPQVSTEVLLTRSAGLLHTRPTAHAR